MAFRLTDEEKVNRLHKLQLSPQSKTPGTVLKWTKLDINDADIDNLPESIGRCRNAKKISATWNGLSTLPQSISNLPHLTELDLFHNAFKTFPIALCGLTNLEVLNLGNNQLSDIPVDISSMKGLRIFWLHNNVFTTFPIALCGLTNLEELYLGNNQLSDIPVEISSMKELRIFKLYNNAFTTFPIALCGLTNLEELHLSFNQLSDIPVNISRMKKLKIFWLNNNAFTTFPIALCGLTNLKVLYLGNNQLSDIPVDISRMKGLILFWLNNNAFTTFPIALCGLTNLRELRLADNQLSDIPVDITRMKGLRIFYLHYNAFTTFPIALCGLTNLEELYLGKNQLSDIPVDIIRIKRLRIFWLSNNALTTFSKEMCELKNLEKLYLISNNITHLPPKIRIMESLRELDVANNPLVQPPKHIANRGLGAIKRYFEALTDTKAIQSSRIQVNFLGEIKAGKTSISRTLQLGESTLTKKADRTRVVEQGTWVNDQDIGFNINDFGGHDVYKIGHPIFISTRGLVFITFNLSTYDPENAGDYQLHIGNWIDKVQAQMPEIKIALIGTHLDIVGNNLAHKKYSLLKKQLTVHKRKKQEWFETQMKKTKVKMSDIDPKQISMHNAYEDKVAKLRTLKDQVSDIHEQIFLVSSKTKAGLNELKHYLTSFARKHAVILPEKWVEAASDICRKRQDSSENTLNLDTLKQTPSIQFKPRSWRTLFMKWRYSDQEIDQTIYDILSYLAHRGDIIWFETSPLLKQTIFHNQEILADLLKAILNHDKDAAIKTMQDSATITALKKREIIEDLRVRGIVSKEAMLCLWQLFNLSAEEVDAMTELMQKLELCYQVQEDESLPPSSSFHFPWLLTEKRQPELDTTWPNKVPPDTTQLTLQVLFPYRCPDGLYEKFSVRQHKHLGLMKTMRMDWKDGVYAELKGCKMQLTRWQNQSNLDSVSQDPDWVISIAVRGSHLSDMWHVLMQGHSDLMDIIKEDWPGLSYDKYLVCPHCVSEDSEHPTLFPGEILDQTIGKGSKPRQVTCINTGVSIPADLVYPPYLTMGWQEVLHKEKTKLCENITEPCLLDMLNVFLQGGIITDREAETVKTEPSPDRVKCPKKVAVFLDILTRKPVRAHETLCRCLQEQGQTDLLELIQ